MNKTENTAKPKTEKKQTTQSAAPKKKTSAPDQPVGAKKKSTASKPGKQTAKKSTPKKTPSPKTAANAPEQEKKPLFAKKTIAQRTVAWKTGRYFDILRWLVLLPLLLLIIFFTFFIAGYSFTVLVCWCLIGIILFYNCTHLLRNKNPRKIRTVRRIFTVILCIGLLVAGITEAIIIKASFGQPEETCDYVIVLGAKVRPDGPSVSLMERINAAYDYMTTYPEVIAVVSGGQGQDEPMAEAQCMFDELIRLGIDENRIWMENQATSTWENLHFSLDLIEKNTGIRPTKIGIVSSEYHLFRASLFADASGVESVGIPARTSRLSQRINHFMREVAGVWHYILLGGQYE